MKKEWKIYHNPRCSKSREALSLLEAKGIQPEIVEYLRNAPSQSELLQLLELLGGEPAQIVRVKEEGFRTQPFDLHDPIAVARELAARPELLERPIVVRGKVAVVARPPEKVNELF